MGLVQKKRGRPMKGSKPRIRMAFTLTPENFHWLGNAAREAGISRSDFLDQIIFSQMRSHLETFADNKIEETRLPRVTVPRAPIVEFCKKHFVEKLSLFGSVMTDQFNSTSDIDVLVRFSPHAHPSLFDMATMEEELTRIFGGRKVDLRTAAELSEHFRDVVLASAYDLYHAS